MKAVDGFGGMAGDADDGFLVHHAHDEGLTAPHGHAIHRYTY